MSSTTYLVERSWIANGWPNAHIEKRYASVRVQGTKTTVLWVRKEAATPMFLDVAQALLALFAGLSDCKPIYMGQYKIVEVVS